MSTRALSASELFQKACDIYDGDRQLATELFSSDIPALGNRKPIELLDSPEDRQLVGEVLNKIQWGEFS